MLYSIIVRNWRFVQGQDGSTAAERNIEKKYFIVDEQIEKKKKRVFLNGFHFENNSFIYCIVASMWSETFPQKILPYSITKILLA